VKKERISVNKKGHSIDMLTPESNIRAHIYKAGAIKRIIIKTTLNPEPIT